MGERRRLELDSPPFQGGVDATIKEMARSHRIRERTGWLNRRNSTTPSAPFRGTGPFSWWRSHPSLERRGISWMGYNQVHAANFGRLIVSFGADSLAAGQGPQVVRGVFRTLSPLHRHERNVGPAPAL